MSNLANHEANIIHGQDRQPLVRLLSYMRPYVALLGVTLVLTLGVSVAQYARAYLMKPLFDDFLLPQQALNESGTRVPWMDELGIPGFETLSGTPQSPPESETVIDPDEEARVLELAANLRQSFIRIVALAALIIITLPLLTFCLSYLMAYILGRVSLDMKVDLCAKLLALPLNFHQGRKRGDILSRAMSDVGRATDALSLLFGNFAQAILMVIVGTAALLYVSWKLSLVMMIAGPLIFGVISLFSSRISKSALRRQEQAADVTQRLIEILGGIKIIKAFRAEKLENEAYRRSSHRLFKRSMKVVKNRVMARALVDMLNNTIGVGVLVLGALLIVGGRWGLSLGDLAAFAGINITLYKPVKSLAKAWVQMMDALPSAERLYQIFDTPVVLRDSPDAVPLNGVREKVALKNVTFSYGREAVLRDVSFEVNVGEVAAIVGRTGAGKTTLVDLLLRLHDPTSGSVEIDGTDIRNIERDSLLDHMAVVTQEPFLFDGTIGDNIRYGRPDASHDEVMAAARAAHVDEFVDRLPEGFDTEVGTGGTRLSGGQRQRVTIARAILRDPEILIFDEATSSLDSKSERLVQDAINALLGGRTVFVIAHRLSTVRRADKIIVIEDGRVSATGTHDELVRGGGLYKELVELQAPERGAGLI